MDIFREWITPIVAVIGLIQFWVRVFWKKYFRTGRVDIYERGKIEIGYGQFSPHLNLHGILRAVDRDQFIRRIKLKVSRLKDGSRHNFPWHSFMSTGSVDGSMAKPSPELPWSFMVTTAKPHRYYISFEDVDTDEEIRQLKQEVIEAWNKFRSDSDLVARELKKSGPGQHQKFEHFTKSDPYAELLAAVDRACYWEPGGYSLEMKIETKDPNKEIIKRWEFELSKLDTALLKQNSSKILAAACGFSYTPFYYIFSSYRVS